MYYWMNPNILDGNILNNTLTISKIGGGLTFILLVFLSLALIKKCIAHNWIDLFTTIKVTFILSGIILLIASGYHMVFTKSYEIFMIGIGYNLILSITHFIFK